MKFSLPALLQLAPKVYSMLVIAVGGKLAATIELSINYQFAMKPIVKLVMAIGTTVVGKKI